MEKANQIAKYNLHACFEGRGIVASPEHFCDYWARDSFFASWGLLELGDHNIVKTNLNLYIEYQTKSGQIPRRIDRFYVTLSYFGIRIKRSIPKATRMGAHFYSALDPNLLFIITVYKYVSKTNDHEFLRTNFEAIHKAIQWLEKYEQDSLLNEGVLAGWMDTILKSGSVLYTNVLYAEALKCFFKISSILGRSSLTEFYAQKYQRIVKIINDEFWNGSYYIDWIKNGKKYDFFSTDGNILAMLFGISNQEQNRQIIKFIEKFKLDEVPIKTNHPSYPAWKVVFWMYLRGTPRYQNNGASWLWLGSLYAIALYKNDYKKKAKRIHEKTAAKIEEYKTVYETYAVNGSPYQGWLWKSTNSFAWSSGLFLWANETIT